MYANKEMNKWVVSDHNFKGQMVALEEITKPYEYDDRPGHNEILHDCGVEAQDQLESSAKLMEFIGDEDHLMQMTGVDMREVATVFCCVEKGTVVLRI